MNIEKLNIIDNTTTIQKANYLSLSNADRFLSFNQMKLLSYSILNLPLDGTVATFSKSDFANFLGVQKYKKSQFNTDSSEIMRVMFSFVDDDFFNEGIERGSLERAVLIPFTSYKDGIITVEFNSLFESGLKNLTTRYLTLDLSIMRQMKTGYSWFLYEHLKKLFGSKYHKIKRCVMSVDEVYELFKINISSPTYKTFGNVRTKILEPALKEINQYTELNVEVDYNKNGTRYSKVTFVWTVEQLEYGPSEQQILLFNNLKEELLSREDFIENPKNKSLILFYKNIDISSMTKGQMGLNIDKINEIIDELNNNLMMTENKKIDLNNDAIISEIRDKSKTRLLEMGYGQSIVDFFGEMLFNSAFEVAKINMKHINSIDSIAIYVANVISDNIQKETRKRDL